MRPQLRVALANFNLGYSPRYGSPVETLISQRLGIALGILLVSSLLVIVANVLMDLLQSWLDPRIGSPDGKSEEVVGRAIRD